MKTITAFVVRAIAFCWQYAWPVIAAGILLAIVSSWYAATHFKMTTNMAQLISGHIPWREREAALEKAFPHFQSIVAVIDAPTPELVDEASGALVQRLSQQKEMFVSIEDPAGGPFFAQNGLLFLNSKDLAARMTMLTQATRLIQVLAGDPSLRGVLQALQFGLLGVQGGRITLDAMTWPMTLAADTIEKVNAGQPASFSWRELVQGSAAKPDELLRFLTIRAVLDFSALEPGLRASDAIRQAAKDLDFSGKYHARLRLTGPVPLEDEEFATIKENAALNASVTIAVVLFILWMALRWWRIIFAVFVNLAVGLSITAAVGLLMVGTLNLISIYFAVLFVGLGVDFGIQFSVRYRAERHDVDDLRAALLQAGRRAGAPLTLAALATAAGFFSFLPTAYKGVSELGLIAGIGMLIAFATSITLLPALLSRLNPPREPEPLGYAALAPVDRFLERNRVPILIATGLVVAAGLPLLHWLRFDFNPMNLRSPKVESVATYLDLKNDPQQRRQRHSGAGAHSGGGRRDRRQTAHPARGCPRDDAVELCSRRAAGKTRSHRQRGKDSRSRSQPCERGRAAHRCAEYQHDQFHASERSTRSPATQRGRAPTRRAASPPPCRRSPRPTLPLGSGPKWRSCSRCAPRSPSFATCSRRMR